MILPTPLICLFGPTASGKTDLALQLAREFPCEIVSVDSVMVYRGLDIGSAKPRPDILVEIPHHLIDIVDPLVSYSAGQFYRDALRAILEIHSRQKIPLLVGGTMLYFRVLLNGIAELPKVNPNVRENILVRAKKIGWEKLHEALMQIDEIAAKKIHPEDKQRIQRALEVYETSGIKLSDWHAQQSKVKTNNILQIALMPKDREQLKLRIKERFLMMLENGLLMEVKKLYERGDLNENLPAIRSLGYKEVWAYLQNKLSYEQMVEHTVIATRQFAKRQYTWLRSWQDAILIHPEDKDYVNQVKIMVQNYLNEI